ncbi:hypothetical protein [Streptomyces sp. NPDC055099]
MPLEQHDKLTGMGWRHSDARHPSPQVDPNLNTIYPDEVCGFDSLDALNVWFEDFGDRLHSAGFHVWEYEAPEFSYRVGKFGQVVFRRDAAELVGHTPFKPVQLNLWADA